MPGTLAPPSHTRSIPSPSATAPFWTLAVPDALRRTASSLEGLATTDAEGRRRRERTVQPHERAAELSLLARQFTNPITLILVFATLLSAILGETTDATIILAIILLSGLLGYWQERQASHTVADLMRAMQTTIAVRRDGQETDIPAPEVVTGDIVLLQTGDSVPGDALVLDADELLLNEAALTGESYPVEKAPGVLPAGTPLGERSNAVFSGTYVVRGRATAVVMATGERSEMGRIATELDRRPAPTRFERSMTSFGRMLLWAMILLVATILVINLAFARPLLESILFALALAVGITPQLLPAIVSASLSAGSRQMARAGVIVKRLNAIEDFGSMDVLCTDKTGTLTEGAVSLDCALGIDGEPDPAVLRAAFLNARLHTGYANPIDDAILAMPGVDIGDAHGLDEAPYDFQRRRLSVLVEEGDQRTILTKGAVEPVLAVCDRVRQSDGGIVPLDTALDDIRRRYVEFGAQGYRVLGVATRAAPDTTGLTATDECGMTFLGLLLFRDPPKPGIDATLKDLEDAGVSLRLLTGDNRYAAAAIARIVGLDPDRVMTGAELSALEGEALARAVTTTTVFAEIEPIHKERIVRALQQAGHTIGFLGDGINDAPALHAADVGISVDTAVNVARDSASIVLLHKDLAVLEEGVRLGRQTFSNTLKYVFITTSANFGNMASMASATLFLPFLPLLPAQVLLTNVLSDIPAMTIAADRVDPSQLRRPGVWDVAYVRRFMIVFGLISSAFDLASFAILRLGFGARPDLFRSGWFLESVGTELAVMLVLRTHLPFWRSRPGSGLLIGSGIVFALTLALPYLPFAGAMGFVAVPPALLAAIAGILIGYVAATEIGKRIFMRGTAA